MNSIDNMIEITFIRHTRVAVPPGTCYGWTDVPLADTFEEEASEVKRQLQDMRFDCTYTSPLTRARRLADYCGYRNAIVDDRLKEMNMGEWEMQRYDEIRDEALQKWYDDYMHLPATGGESFPMLRKRVAEFIDDLRMKPHHHVGVFTHAGVIVSAGLYSGLFEEANAFSHQPGYGGVLRILLSQK